MWKQYRQKKRKTRISPPVGENVADESKEKQELVRRSERMWRTKERKTRINLSAGENMENMADERKKNKKR